jgi:hypothetical protein
MGIITHECIEFLLDRSSIAASIPDEETIFTPDDRIMRISDAFPIDEVIEIILFIRGIHFSIVIYEVSAPEIPLEIREKVSPSRGCHVDVDGISVILMEMDSILRFNSLRDIAPSDFFHIDIS